MSSFGDDGTWMTKEFGQMHDEVSSSFMKQAQTYHSLSHQVATVKEQIETLCKENGDKEDRIRKYEADLAREDDKVQHLRAEHETLEGKVKRLRDTEEQLEETRAHEHKTYLQNLDKYSRQMYASRQAVIDASKSPELIDEARMLLTSFEDGYISKLVQGDAFEMQRYGLNLKGFEMTAAAYANITERLAIGSG